MSKVLNGNENRKKHRLRLLIFSLAMLFLMLLTGIIQYRIYARDCNEKLNRLCLLITEKYPEVSGGEIMELLSSDEEAQGDFFASYGIDVKKDAAIYADPTKMYAFLLWDAGLVVLTILGVMLIWQLDYRKKMDHIEELSKDVVRINAGDYHFDMEENEEGSISILGHELYKTTIMLREAAENSIKDKENLKNSLSDISHQLKTPLTSLLINLENLEGLEGEIKEGEIKALDMKAPDMNEEGLEALRLKRRRLVSAAKRDVNKINQMVQLLLKLSRLEANAITFERKKISIPKLIAMASESVLPLCDLKGIELVGVEDKEDPDAMLLCDPFWEQEAITNILKNGIEHAKSKVTVSYYSAPMYKEIVIENDGEPMSSEEAKHVLERFYQGSNASKDSVGIGLSLADAIIRQDGGHITVVSDEMRDNAGAKFIIRYN